MALTEDFSGSTLPSGWTIDSPVGGEAVEVTGDRCEITVPSGTEYDTIFDTSGADNSAGVAHDIETADVDIAVQCDMNPTGTQWLGWSLLVFGATDDDAARFSLYQNDGGAGVVFGYLRESGGSDVSIGNDTISDEPPFSGLWQWARIQYDDATGDWTFLGSVNGVDWTTVQSGNLAFTPARFKAAITSVDTTPGGTLRIQRVVDVAAAGTTDLRESVPDPYPNRVTTETLDGDEGSLPAGWSDDSANGGSITWTGSSVQLTSDLDTDGSRARLAWSGDLHGDTGILLRAQFAQTTNDLFLVAGFGQSTGNPDDQYSTGPAYVWELNGSNTRRLIRVDPVDDVTDFEAPYARLLMDANGDGTDALWIRIERVGRRIRGRTWLDADPEPSGWDYDGDDSVHGDLDMGPVIGVSHNDGTSGGDESVAIDSLEVYELSEVATGTVNMDLVALSPQFTPRQVGDGEFCLRQARPPAFTRPTGVDEGLLSRAPPEGWEDYTVRTITQEEADPGGVSVLRIALDDNTDYILDTPHKITRSVRLEGGRNIVWIGGHIEINYARGFYNSNVRRGVTIHDGDNAVDREIFIEGVLVDGDDLEDAWMINDSPAAHYTFQNCRSGPSDVRSSDAFDGTNHYLGVGQNHPDGMQSLSGTRGQYYERCTFMSTHTAARWRETVSPTGENVRLRKVNTRMVRHMATEEGPVDVTGSFTDDTVRFDWEGGSEGWNAPSGGTATIETGDPITGTRSLRVENTTADPEVFAGETFDSPVDWSGSPHIAATVRLLSGGGPYPTARIDVTTDDSLFLPASVENGWFVGEPVPLETDTDVMLFGSFPESVLSAIAGIRIVLFTGGEDATHAFLIDDVRSGTGELDYTFNGPTFEYQGKWGYYVNPTDDAPTLYLDEGTVWADWHEDGLFVDGDNHRGRFWDEDAQEYVMDPQPGTADLSDFVFTVGGDVEQNATGNYIQDGIFQTSRFRDWRGEGNAKIYGGIPPGGDYCPEGVAGLNYQSPGYLTPSPGVTALAPELRTWASDTVFSTRQTREPRFE